MRNFLVAKKLELFYKNKVAKHFSLQEQSKALKAAGVQRVKAEIHTGTDFNRPVLNDLLNMLEPGDELIVCRLDRIGRSLIGTIELISQLKEKGVIFKSLDLPFDQSDGMYTIFLALIAFFAEYELQIRKERQRIGIEAAKKARKYKGRPSTMTPKKLAEIEGLLTSGYSKQKTAKYMNISRATLYRALKQIEKKKME